MYRKQNFQPVLGLKVLDTTLWIFVFCFVFSLVFFTLFVFLFCFARLHLGEKRFRGSLYDCQIRWENSAVLSSGTR